jgi:hypothetical protein
MKDPTMPDFPNDPPDDGAAADNWFANAQELDKALMDADGFASAQEFNDAQPRGWGGCGMQEV